MMVPVFVTIALSLLAINSSWAQEAALLTNEIRPNCTNCDCTRQAGIFHLQCNFNGSQSLLLDSQTALDFNLSTFYMRLQAAAALRVTTGFLRHLRKYQSVAIDLWGIGRIDLPTDHQPATRFQFIGIGIANSSVPVLPEGLFSHSRTVGLRLSRVHIGAVAPGAFADIQKVRYVEVRQCQVDVIGGPHTGVITLSPRHDIHHGSRGLVVDASVIGVIESGALAVSTGDAEEFVVISDSQIEEVGREGLTVVGPGSVRVTNSRLQFLGTRALAARVGGDIVFDNVTIDSTAPLPLSGIRGGNRTHLRSVTFHTAPSASAVLLDSPAGTEELVALRFACRGGQDDASEWVRPIERSTTTAAAHKWYLRNVAAAILCDNTSNTTTHHTDSGGNVSPEQSGNNNRAMTDCTLPDRSATSRSESRVAGPSTSSSDGVFGSAARVGLELAILTVFVALIAVVALLVIKRRKRKRTRAPDARMLMEEEAYQ